MPFAGRSVLPHPLQASAPGPQPPTFAGSAGKQEPIPKRGTYLISLDTKSHRQHAALPIAPSTLDS